MFNGHCFRKICNYYLSYMSLWSLTIASPFESVVLHQSNVAVWRIAHWLPLCACEGAFVIFNWLNRYQTNSNFKHWCSVLNIKAYKILSFPRIDCFTTVKLARLIFAPVKTCSIEHILGSSIETAGQLVSLKTSVYSDIHLLYVIWTSGQYSVEHCCSNFNVVLWFIFYKSMIFCFFSSN